MDPVIPLAGLQAIQAAVDNPDVQELVRPSRRIASEHLARTTDIVLSALNASLSGLVRFRMSQEAKTREHGAILDLGERSADIKRTVFFEELQKRVSLIPEERQQLPPLHIAGPSVEAMLFTEDTPELRKLYVNLIGTSMDSATVRTAHPAFVQIIRQISPDEAHILKILRPGSAWPEIDLLAVSLEDADSFDTLAQHVSTLGAQSGCLHPDLTPVYVDNLCRLGIAAIPFGGFLDDDSVYVALEEHPVYIAQKEVAMQRGKRLTSRRSYLTLTDFGRLFWEACVEERV